MTQSSRPADNPEPAGDSTVSSSNEGRSSFKTFAAVAGLVLSALYLANPGLGVFELIPDALPGIGNLDELSAAALFLACLRYLGLDLTRWFKSPE